MRFLATDVWVQSEDSSCVVYDEKMLLGQVFFEYVGIPPPIIISPVIRYTFTIIMKDPLDGLP